MPYSELGDKLSVGFEAFDDDHAKLLALIDELRGSLQTGNAKDVLGKVLAGITLYTGFHFAREEELLLLTQYPGYAAHRREHQGFSRVIEELLHDFHERSSDALPYEVLEFLEHWLFEHSLVACFT
jgi:hemerythrin